MKLFYKIFVLALAISLFNCRQSQDQATKTSSETSLNGISYKYFFSVPFRESPYPQFNGIYPTTKDNVKQRHYYRFAYDDSNRLVEMSVMRNDHMVINLNSNNFFFGVAKITFSYSENTETLHFYNFLDEQISPNGVWKAVYTLNDNGERTSLHYYDANDQAVDNGWGISRYEWSKDEQGRIKEQRFNLQGEQAMLRPQFDFYEVRLTYDNRGYLTTMENYGTTGELTNNSTGVAMDKLQYDQHGNFTQWKVYNKDNEPVIGNLPGTAGGNHYYNSYGDQIKTEVFDLNDSLMVANWRYAYVEHTFNDQGNSEISKYFDDKKEIIDIGENVNWVKLKYDHLNQLIKVSFYNKNGEIAQEGSQNIAHALYTYDEQHNMTERKYLDKDDNLVINTLRGFAVAKYERDTITNTVDTLKYDTKMKLIKE